MVDRSRRDRRGGERCGAASSPERRVHAGAARRVRASGWDCQPRTGCWRSARSSCGPRPSLFSRAAAWCRAGSSSRAFSSGTRRGRRRQPISASSGWPAGTRGAPRELVVVSRRFAESVMRTLTIDGSRCRPRRRGVTAGRRRRGSPRATSETPCEPPPCRAVQTARSPSRQRDTECPRGVTRRRRRPCRPGRTPCDADDRTATASSTRPAAC